MNEAFVSIAPEVFAAACGAGPSTLPTGMAQVVEYLENGGELAPDTFESLGQQLATQFPFLRHRSLVNVQCDETARASWEAGVRAVLERLRHWSPSNPIAFAELSTSLYTIDALGLDSVDVGQVAAQLGNDALADELYHLICEAEVGSFMPGHDRIPNAEQEIKASAQRGNFLKVSHLLPHVMPEPRASLWSAVRLLWRLDPAKLAEAMAINDSVFLALLVRFTLQDDFPALALSVPVMWLKYASIDDIENAHRRGSNAHDWDELLRQLLLQAADTSAWAGWMDALLRAPYSGSLMCIALPKALASLQMSHWTAFVSAVNLSYSKRSAEPIASIMATFAQEVEESAASAMWSMCFDRWTNWNYGKNEHQVYLFAPATCAFDYPVAMYYSQMPSHERDDFEAALTLSVNTIEQQWFNSSTDLITERNRLLSRLRLVVHGRKLADGDAELLPPEIQPPSDYARVRYSYHDVQAKV
ncbi:hypothetical protein [Paraburkholderia kirstenboschensis]|uniref:Uncharacterized protein n=1 Tax=Paraburkholderia kirstenboschensis TaxID=1245436 RepID=A0ABZ0EK66_9BURK|nr:hypothetical protein [Paraburkholderia kirstenboschensis]WOD16994.1 hypothetical protein RW095_14190 [Paraburkholderia kirstenboschensis]